jgi:hypothetical protein
VNVFFNASTQAALEASLLANPDCSACINTPSTESASAAVVQTSCEAGEGWLLRNRPTTFLVAVRMHVLSEGREIAIGDLDNLDLELKARRSWFLRRLIGRSVLSVYQAFFTIDSYE